LALTLSPSLTLAGGEKAGGTERQETSASGTIPPKTQATAKQVVFKKII
jgi:hypothetical protein